MVKRVAVFIPARMESVRLPGKPLADIAGKPMVVRVWERCMLAQNVDEVYVACADREIMEVVEKHGGKAIMTDAAHPSGTDRIYEAMCQVGEEYDYIVNVQGDLPLLEPGVIDRAVALLDDDSVDIATLVAIVKDENERDDPNVVKAVIAFEGDDYGRALYFSRACVPTGEGDVYHHIGLYAYRQESLRRFVGCEPSALELREKLEQLRALENNMTIGVALVDVVPIGVDTQDDLDMVRSSFDS